MKVQPSRSVIAFALEEPDAFSRQDETEDRLFYARDRLVHHLDATARQTLTQWIGSLVVEKRPRILDLMASWDSHLPDGLDPEEVVGLGMNAKELDHNPRLTERVVHDLNLDPRLPFEDGRFDVVINAVSVDYLTRPVEVFAEVARVLKPGGVYLVFFSNRMFPEKAVKVWKEATEAERVRLVEGFFQQAGGFLPTVRVESIGKPRPREDKYAYTGLPSDPLYLVYAEKLGAGAARSLRPTLTADPPADSAVPGASNGRRQAIRDPLRCPHCGERMKKWAVPQSPFTQWDNEFMYICFNDSCPYLQAGWKAMQEQGNGGLSYRCMYNPVSGSCMPVPVPNLLALRESIVEEETGVGA